MIMILIWAMVQRFFYNEKNIICNLLLCTVPVVLASIFVCLSYPSKIIRNDDEIIFYSVGMSHLYNFDNITKLTVKEFFLSDMYLVTIDDYKLCKGRYWISNKIDKHQELLSFFRQKENECKVKIQQNHLRVNKNNGGDNLS